jgi:hypothetical protein
MSAEDRVRAAAEATAASVRQIRPLALPDSSAVSAEPREHRDGTARGILRKFRDTWIIPLAAAAVVVALALTLVTLRHPEASSPASSTSGTSAAADAAAVTGIPRYYVIATEGKESHEGKAAIDVTVGDVRTGKAIATVATPAVYVGGNNAAAGVSAAGDDRTFVVGSRNIYGGIAYYQVRIAPGAKQVATIEPLPIPQVAVGNLLGFAVSPDGKELAALSVRGNGTTLRIYSVKSGATLRSWIAGTWKNQGGYGIQQTGVSWTADGLQVGFFTTVTTGRNQSDLVERVINATAPSGDLATASKAVFKAPGNCTSLLLTPDGGTVVCATQANYPSPIPPATATGCGGKNGPMFVAYSAATGKLLRVLYQYTGACDQGVDTVLWSDDSARHVIGEQELFQSNPPQHFDRYGVAAAGKFTKFQVAQHGQWYSGPAF